MSFRATSSTTLLAGYVARSNSRGALVVACDFAIAIAVIALAVWIDHVATTVLAIWLVGMKQFSIGEALVHEAAHGNLFRSKRLNESVGDLCALPFFYTLNQYRGPHLRHHARLGTGEDPIANDYQAFGFHCRARHPAFLLFAKPATGYAAYIYIRWIVAPGSIQNALKTLAFWTLALSLALHLQWMGYLVIYWFTPMLFVYATLLYWSELEDHCGTRSGTRSNIATITNLLVNHNSGFHHIHHDNPAIPWYNLKRAHDRHFVCGDVSKGFFDTCRQIIEHFREDERNGVS